MAHEPCDDCSSFDFSCTGRCIKPFGVRLRVKKVKIPAWAGNVRRSALEPDHPESIPNWIRKNLGIEPESWMYFDHLIEEANKHHKDKEGMQ